MEAPLLCARSTPKWWISSGRPASRCDPCRSTPIRWVVIVADRNGIPFGVAIDGANRNDSVMLAPTLDDAKAKGLLEDIETIWFDRAYDSDATRQRLVEREITDAVIAKKR